MEFEEAAAQDKERYAKAMKEYTAKQRGGGAAEAIAVDDDEDDDEDGDE